MSNLPSPPPPPPYNPEQVSPDGQPRPPIATAPSAAQPITNVSSSSGSALRGCWWVVGGAVGCLTVIVGLIGGLILLSGVTINSFFDGVFDIFDRQPVDYSVFVPVVDRVSELSELTTMRYNYANIVTSQFDMPEVLRALYGDRLVMVAVGHIEAGVDLDQLTQEDIVIDEETGILRVTLPPVTLQNCFLDESKIQVISRETGLFAAPPTSLDSAARRYAIRQFRDQAIEEGLLTDAQTEAERVIREFVSVVALASGFDAPPEIVFEHTPVDPATDLVYPETCL